MKNCPYCGEEIKDNAKKCKHCGEWLKEDSSSVIVSKEKRCPYCGEEVLSTAKKCKHCGTWFIAHEEQSPTLIQKSKRCEFCGCIIPEYSTRCPKCGEWLVDENTELSCGYGFNNSVVKWIFWITLGIAIFILIIGTIIAIGYMVDDPETAIGGYVVFLFILAICLGLSLLGDYIYFLPSIFAKARNHPQFVPILLINLFFGGTVIGWIGSLIWAISHRMGRHTHW